MNEMKVSSKILDELRSHPLSFRLMQLRAMHGYTQTELAKQIGVAKVTITSWEKSRCIPSVKSIGRLILLYDLPTDFFIDADEMRDKRRGKE